MDPYEGYFKFTSDGKVTKVSDFPCVLLNDPDRLTDSSKTAESLSENVSV